MERPLTRTIFKIYMWIIQYVNTVCGHYAAALVYGFCFVLVLRVWNVKNINKYFITERAALPKYQPLTDYGYGYQVTGTMLHLV